MTRLQKDIVSITWGTLVGIASPLLLRQTVGRLLRCNVDSLFCSVVSMMGAGCIGVVIGVIGILISLSIRGWVSRRTGNVASPRPEP